VFGRFEDDECVEVVDGGSGVPREDIGNFTFKIFCQKNGKTHIFLTQKRKISTFETPRQRKFYRQFNIKNKNKFR
jgi:hypothetical protein